MLLVRGRCAGWEIQHSRPVFFNRGGGNFLAIVLYNKWTELQQIWGEHIGQSCALLGTFWISVILLHFESRAQCYWGGIFGAFLNRDKN